MSRKLLALPIAAALTLPATAGAYEVIGEKLEIYGKAHLSLDIVDNDTDSNVALASNSSRLGFKGAVPINDRLFALYQIESKVVFDEGGADLASRTTYLGLGGDFGKLLVGYQDTPLKGVRSTFDMFGDTVGDARNILDEGNVRARNSIQYLAPSLGGLSLKALYSTAYDDQETAEGLEENDYQLYSLSAGYEIGDLALQAGYEHAGSPVSDQEWDGVRLAGVYGIGPFALGAIYERRDQGDAERDAFGVNGAYTLGANTFKVQYVMADEIGDVADSDAAQLSLGVDHKLAKHTTVYGIYSLLDNADAAAYRIKGGHDTDVYEVAAAGDDISVFSLGIVHKF